MQIGQFMRVVLEDRHGKKQEAFTFGGDLTVKSQEQQTICTLVSNAPIFDASAASPLNKLFIDEVEIILAKQRAKFSKHTDFEEILCKADPFTLYLACLYQMIPELEQYPHQDDTHRDLLNYLHTQVERLEAARMLTIPAVKLEKIFR